jgi:hypothetical protein
MTLRAETPGRLPVAFSDRPAQWRPTASRFTAAGMPRGAARVNCRPQPLQRQRCRPQAWPDLISAVPPQAGQAPGCSDMVASRCAALQPFS